VPAQVHRQGVEAIGEVRRDEVPPVTKRRPAMDEQQRRPSLAAVIDAVNLKTGSGKLAVAHGNPALSKRSNRSNRFQAALMVGQAFQPVVAFFV
jgi:hypothetical protein